ncbi:carboxylesterase [Pseudoflavonifractor sp. MSJ-37]|uniref:alpha/beta hydrolase n=1 Tax=Pseudoflavonifractor sp. MSJ-37 TaxID=2841531 RepID=UPI001C0F5B90|nr:alpha/beta hydrolase [Pseudoflavonifractor sp. MSJ-37]MBU5435631.1 alpha/beta hydrolase [Pseudoflavonifractor sp. MSJ-37]
MSGLPARALTIGGAPAVLYGAKASSVWLFVHGQSGRKEEAEPFAQIVCPAGGQVLAIDLPGHGERQDRDEALLPWTAAPELAQAGTFLRDRWGGFSLLAVSIGAWLSLLALDRPERALLVSPVLDMERLIRDMMGWAGVTEDRLRAEGTIPTGFGQTLSWDYLTYVRSHPVHDWGCPVSVLIGGQDQMLHRETAAAFAAHPGRSLTVYEPGEHWFHTPDQLQALAAWERAHALPGRRGPTLSSNRQRR